MQVTQEKRPGSRIGLTIAVDAAQVKRAYDKTVRQMVQNAQIQGFRKGKAPASMVIRFMGRERVNASALDDLINDSVKQALKDSQINALTQFQLDEGVVEQIIAQFNPEASLTFSGSVEVYPEAKLVQYKDLSVTVKRVDFDPAQVDQAIDRWRDQRATLLPVEDRPAQMGDVAVVDFVGTDAEGNSIEGGSGSDFQVELKEGNFIAGFVEGIVGMALEETRSVEAKFPEDYFQPELAGQTGTFSITLKELKTKELPELDDSFVAEISDFQTVEELRRDLEERFRSEALQASANNLEEGILDKILETAEIDLPRSLVQQEATQLLSRSLSNMGQDRNIDPGEMRRFLSTLPPATQQQLLERFQSDAEQRLRRTLTLASVVDQEQISVGSTELEVAVDDLMATYEGQLERGRVQEVMRESLLRNKVMAWLKSQTTVTWTDAEGNPVDPPDLAQLEVRPEPEASVPEANFDAPELSTANEDELTIEAAAVVVDAADSPEA